ncbi:MAG TPA: tetratricopeptide repeat protein [Verrucomicrobiota bacterium]|nr:tetratricopeptide repeat protein [Verrucomicrobiota bacterium]
MRFQVLLNFGLAGLLVLLGGCDRRATSDASTPPAQTLATPSTTPLDDLLAYALAPHAGDTSADREIRRLQDRVRQARDPGPWIERLGWAFVAKARASFDPGYYRLASHCADALEQRNPGSPEGQLLRGHILHQEHRFREAEPVARQLAKERGLAADFGLLGDVLMEQGRLNEAAEAYQQMMDLRPDLHAYARGAHLRWLKGDLAGALELIDMAVGAASPQSPEAAAWVTTRLGQLQLQAGNREAAEQACQAALQFQADYAPALLLRGRLLLGDQQSTEAIAALQQAVRINPLPEYQWTLAEALRAADRVDEAEAIEVALDRTGASTDPRTYSLYLATTGKFPDLAVRLAAAELDQRADVFTHDAVAWSLAAAGKNSEAWDAMQRALAEGTLEPRLFFHAAIIARKAGHAKEAEIWFERASESMHLLLPSELDQLMLSLPDGDETAATAEHPDATSHN